jgi:hypothetical protein
MPLARKVRSEQGVHALHVTTLHEHNVTAAQMILLTLRHLHLFAEVVLE